MGISDGYYYWISLNNVCVWEYPNEYCLYDFDSMDRRIFFPKDDVNLDLFINNKGVQL